MKLAYFVPAFPTQTHGFFWQEICDLRSANIDLVICSSKKPKAWKNEHAWAKEARSETLYSVPILKYWQVFYERCDHQLIKRFLYLFRRVLRTKDVGFLERFKLLFLTFVALVFGAHLEAADIDHIHSHFQFHGADLVYFINQLYGIPYSITRHGENCGVGNQLAKWRHASFGIIVTQDMYKKLFQEIPDLGTPLAVAPMGIDTGFFKRSKPFQPFNREGTIKLFCCSRLNPSKGYVELFKLVIELKSRGMDIELKVAGQDEKNGSGYFLELSIMRERYGLMNNIELLGAVTKDRIKEELEQTHLFVLPTKQEALGVAYMEAMAMEVPVIGCRTGGVPELIKTQVNGILVEPGNVKALEEAVLQLVKDPHKAKSLGQAGRRTVLKSFSKENSVRALLAALETRPLDV
ncbi:MAG: glycosyltransferase family 4 protein [Pseudobacteriovorax sp.]|nr:glycosyltransferase family 4 protein [Pseudobacteriovorax sp.]